MPGWPLTVSHLARLVLASGLLAASVATPVIAHADDSAASVSADDVADVAPVPDDAQQTQSGDPRLFSQTGFRVDRDNFWTYFQQRGGVRTFGYPASRDFPFMGCTTQFFQRLVMQQCSGQPGVGTLNLLDDGLLPYTRMNGSTFPAPDDTLKAATPRVTDTNYSTAILDFVRANAPDTFEGEPVNFGKTFFSSIAPEVAGTTDPNMLGLLDLEMWGAPTSKPARDPSNSNFIYQRFQRGIMHYDKSCGCTQSLLLADYLKALLTGDNLPGDLAAQAATSKLLRAASAGVPPAGTVFGNAFTPGAGSATAIARPLPPALAQFGNLSPNPPELVPSPDFGLSMFLWDQPQTSDRDLKIASAANFRWQKTVFQWSQIEGKGKGQFDWTEADRVVKATNAAGLKVIGRLDFQPAWARKDGAHNGPPDNYQDYWDFVSAFVSHYKAGSPNGSVDAVEVWNEVNLTREWGMKPINREQASDYVRLLTGAYQAAHKANPNIYVISAGLSPTGVHSNDAWDDAEYMQWLFDAGLKGGINYDVLGAHGNTQAPCVECDLNSLPAFSHPSFYFRRVEQLRQIQVTAGDANRQIWLLEFGWTADPIHPNYSWFAVSEDQKAANIVKAYQYAKKNWTPWIGVMTLWTLSDPQWSPKDEEYWWAITNPDGTARPAFDQVKAALKTGI